MYEFYTKDDLESKSIQSPLIMTAMTEILIVTTTDSGGNTRQQQIQIPRTINASTARAIVVNNNGILTNGLQPEIEPQPTHSEIMVQTPSQVRPTGRSSSGGTLDKPFQCNTCERKFRQLSTLTNHVKIHTGEKPYKCSICEKYFRQSSTLTNHLKIHTGEKPFSCNYCLKQFRQLSTLTNHLKIHTGEKPFECAVCKKQFRQSSTLNNHIKIHVMDKLYIPIDEIKEEEEEG